MSNYDGYILQYLMMKNTMLYEATDWYSFFEEVFFSSFSFLFSVIVGIRVSLRAPRLISRDPEVNDHVNLQWSWSLWHLNWWSLESKLKAWSFKLHSSWFFLLLQGDEQINLSCNLLLYFVYIGSSRCGFSLLGLSSVFSFILCTKTKQALPNLLVHKVWPLDWPYSS